MLYTDFVTEGLLYERENEAVAVKMYNENALAEGEIVIAEEPGLMMSRNKPFLGASLDRIVKNTQTGKKWGLEAKCPISKASMTVEEACRSKHFFLEKTSNSVIQLKRKHDYYYQLQGQLFVSGFEFINFVVYFGRGKPIFDERIISDRDLVYNLMRCCQGYNISTRELSCQRFLLNG